MRRSHRNTDYVRTASPRHHRYLSFLAVPFACFLVSGAAAGEKPKPSNLEWPSAGFEAEGWTLKGEPFKIVKKNAKSGAACLQVKDSGSIDAFASGPYLPAKQRAEYIMGCQVRQLSGGPLIFVLQAFDENKRLLNYTKQYDRAKPSGAWRRYSQRFVTPVKTSFIRVCIQSYKRTIEAYLDDFTLTDTGKTMAQPRVVPNYHKVRKDDPHPMTKADLLGPDGLVYPDWRHAGVPGGIPEKHAVVVRASDHGAAADDDKDDTTAFEKAISVVAKKGGGVIEIGAGTFHLDRPLIITRSNIVLRGQGPKKTKLIFRYMPAKKTPQFINLKDGGGLYPGSWGQVHFNPGKLTSMHLLVDGKEVLKGTHGPGTFFLNIKGSTLIGKRSEGVHTLTARGVYGKTEKFERSIKMTFHKKNPADRAVPNHLSGKLSYGAITFVGDYGNARTAVLAEDAKRGDDVLKLKDAGSLAVGDAIALEAPRTKRWNALVKNACTRWGNFRRSHYRIEQIDGNAIRINQPVRLTFPAVDKSFVRTLRPIRRCGVESLSVQQPQKLWTCGVLFVGAWECWARDLHVHKTGRNAAYVSDGKWCEFRDLVLKDAWYLGGGGTGYVGGERCYDCLWENVESHRMRHAPLVEWSAAGNVFRNSTFYRSDMQWHSGWTNENLFENCVVHSAGYGYGGWASPPHDGIHGPTGPRNVVYNCDFTSTKDGLWFGGMNSGWIVVGNRFVVQNGAGIWVGGNSSEHYIAKNVFVLKSGHPGVKFAKGGSPGLHIIDNAIHGGNGLAAAGQSLPAVSKGNTTHPAVTKGKPLPARPELAVPSIFEWQRKHHPLTAK